MYKCTYIYICEYPYYMYMNIDIYDKVLCCNIEPKPQCPFRNNPRIRNLIAQCQLEPLEGTTAAERQPASLGKHTQPLALVLCVSTRASMCAD